jgi:hypothetical protein
MKALPFILVSLAGFGWAIDRTLTLMDAATRVMQ